MNLIHFEFEFKNILKQNSAITLWFYGCEHMHTHTHKFINK